MSVRERLCRIIRMPSGNYLASDAAGRIHLIDQDLNLLRSSPANRVPVPFYCITEADGWIVGRDKLGNAARWNAQTLHMTHWIPTQSLADESRLLEDEEPSLTISRGIAVSDGKVYFNNGYMQLVVLDLATFELIDVRPSPSGDTPIEWICVDHPRLDALTDKHGNLYLGDLETGSFPHTLSLDEDANLHRVQYDQVHDRFWVIQDEGSGDSAMVSNGVVTVTTQGEVDQELQFASDDIECLEFSLDGRRVVAAGFDGVIEEFDNSTSVLTRSRTFGDFSHQVSDMVLTSEGDAIVLCQNGCLTKVASNGAVLAEHDFTPQCMWDVGWSGDDSSVLEFATDQGVLALAVSSAPGGRAPTLTQQRTVELGLGFCRRVCTLSQGGGLVITRSGEVARYNDHGVVWTYRPGGLLHDLAVSPDESRLAVAANSGGYELSVEDGATLETFEFGEEPVWACSYAGEDGLVFSTRAGGTVVLDKDRSLSLSFEVGDYPKRMWQHSDGSLVTTGAGGIRRFDVTDGTQTHFYSESLSNTAENVVFHNGFVYVVTYDSQLGVFREEGEFLGVIEGVLPDFPKALALVEQPGGDDYLLIGGRGGYVCSFELAADGTPVHKGTSWFSGGKAQGQADLNVELHAAK